MKAFISIVLAALVAFSVKADAAISYAPQYATQAEAEAGTATNKTMNPARTKDAINMLGGMLQSVSATYTANTALSTTIPLDDTIPQNTEGTEILTVSITPKSASSTIEVEFQCTGASASAQTMIVALFKDSGADAIAATAVGGSGSGAKPNLLRLIHREASGSKTARTYKINVGMNSGSITMNGATTGRYMGGTEACYLIAREVN